MKDLAFSSRFDLDDHWVFKLELHRMDGAALVSPLENPSFTRDWYLLAVKSTFSF